MIKELMVGYPKTSIVLISFLVTLFMTLVTKFFTDQKRMKELKEVQKQCQIKIKDAQGDLKKQSEIQTERMNCSLEMMKYSMKPMLITFIPLLIVIGFLRGVYSEVLSSWIWWYILSGMISSMILRKVLNVA